MKLYYAFIDDFDDLFFKETAFALIPYEKRKNIDKIVNIKSRKESLLAWSIICRLLKKEGHDISICFEENGKPYLKNADIQFSLSHSDGMVCCAVGNCCVGADVQKKSFPSEKVMKRVLSKKEMSAILKSDDPARDFTVLWTAKESYSKYTGRGLSENFSQLDFSSMLSCETSNYYDLHLMRFKIDDFFFCICTSLCQNGMSIDKITQTFFV